MDPTSAPVQVALAEGASLPPEVLQSIQEEVRRMSEKSGIAVKELQILVQTSDSTGSQMNTGNSLDGIPQESFTLKVQKDASNEIHVLKIPHTPDSTAIKIVDSDSEDAALMMVENQDTVASSTAGKGNSDASDCPANSLQVEDGETSSEQATIPDLNTGEVSTVSKEKSPTKRGRGRPPKIAGSTRSPAKNPAKKSQESTHVNTNHSTSPLKNSDDGLPVSEQESPIKSRRGRPPKNVSSPSKVKTPVKPRPQRDTRLSPVEEPTKDAAKGSMKKAAVIDGGRGRPKRNRVVPQRFQENAGPQLRNNGHDDGVDDDCGGEYAPEIESDDDVDLQDFGDEDDHDDDSDSEPHVSTSELKSASRNANDEGIAASVKATKSKEGIPQIKENDVPDAVDTDNMNVKPDTVTEKKTKHAKVASKKNRGRKREVVKDDSLDEKADDSPKVDSQISEVENLSGEFVSEEGGKADVDDNNCNKSDDGSKEASTPAITGKTKKRKKRAPLGEGVKKKRLKSGDSTQEKFECEKCPKSYKNAYQLSRHCCNNEEARTCKECGKVYKRRQHLNNHIKHVHEKIPKKVIQKKYKEGPVSCQCTLCGKVLHSRSGLTNHMKGHRNEKNFICHLCDKSFIQKNNLLVHISAIHEMKKPFLCPSCGDSFSQQAGYDYHIRSHLYTERLKECAEIAGSPMVIPDQSQNTSLQHDDVKCLFCDQLFGHLIRYLYHLREHLDSTPESEWDPEVLAKAHTILTKNEDVISNVKIYKCGNCGKVYLDQQQLKYHLKVHEVPHGFAFACKFCDKQFTSRSGLVFHQRSHTNEYKFICGHCKRGFARMGSLTKHCKTYHASDSYSSGHPRQRTFQQDRFRCDDCSKVFGSAYNLRVHMRTHSKEQPFTCAVCSKSFTDPSNLIAHGKRHHPEHPKDTFGSSVKRKKLKEFMQSQAKVEEENDASSSNHENVENVEEILDAMVQ